MKIVEPTGAFKVLGGNIVLHCGLLLGLIILSKSKHAINKHMCQDLKAQQLIRILIISHAISAAISIFYQVALITRRFTMLAVLEILRIVSYFYISIYVWFYALEFNDHPSCVHGTYPLDHFIVYMDLLFFFIWVCSIPIFMIIKLCVGYTSQEDRRVV